MHTTQLKYESQLTPHVLSFSSSFFFLQIKEYEKNGNEYRTQKGMTLDYYIQKI